MRIVVLALDQLWATGLTVTLDAFSLANNFSARQMGGAPYFDVSVVDVQKKVRSGLGLSIPKKTDHAIKPLALVDLDLIYQDERIAHENSSQSNRFKNRIELERNVEEDRRRE